MPALADGHQNRVAGKKPLADPMKVERPQQAPDCEELPPALAHFPKRGRVDSTYAQADPRVPRKVSGPPYYGNHQKEDQPPKDRHLRLLKQCLISK